MVEEFMVCVDRILASSSPSSPAADNMSGSNDNNSQRERLLSTAVSEPQNNNNIEDFGGTIMEVLKTQRSGENEEEKKLREKKGFLRECRICQEEDDDDKQDLEAPCACNGTLKFAHRKCIQRWCNKKGDITCEICNQVFSPNYILPPKQSNGDVMAIDIRQAWGSNLDLRDPHLLALAAAEHQFFQSEYEEYAITNSSTLSCFRLVAIIVMLLLLVRHTLLVTRDFGMLQESSGFFRFQISLLQLAGFLLPCYVMARSWYILQCRRRRQDLDGQTGCSQGESKACSNGDGFPEHRCPLTCYC